MTNVSSALAESAADHALAATPETVHWGYFSANVESAIELRPGETIGIDTVNGGRDRLPEDRNQFQVLPFHQKIIEECRPSLGPHILTGPVDIAGAKPGDLLCVKIRKVELTQNWGWNEICPGTGMISSLETDVDNVIIPLDQTTGTIRIPWGNTVKAEPFFGVMGVKPQENEGEITSLVPGNFGGNIDLKFARPGTTVCLPVHIPGAGFSVGDGHALQGDGEIVGTAIETSLFGEFRLHIAENAATDYPFVLGPDWLISTATNADLERAVAEALQQAVKLLCRYYQISPTDAYRHCGLLADLRIAQMVNINVGAYVLVQTTSLTPTDELRTLAQFTGQPDRL